MRNKDKKQGDAEARDTAADVATPWTADLEINDAPEAA